MGLLPDRNTLMSAVWQSLKSSFLGGKVQGRSLWDNSLSSDLEVEVPCYTGLLFPGLSLLSCAWDALVREVHLCHGEYTKVHCDQVGVKLLALSLPSNAVCVFVGGKFSPHFAYLYILNSGMDELLQWISVVTFLIPKSGWYCSH